MSIPQKRRAVQLADGSNRQFDALILAKGFSWRGKAG